MTAPDASTRYAAIGPRLGLAKRGMTQPEKVPDFVRRHRLHVECAGDFRSPPPTTRTQS
jgi:hypothetical protein